MKRMKKAINLIPVGVLLTIAVLAFQKWQAVQALKPDYNNPNPASQGVPPRPGRDDSLDERNKCWQIMFELPKGFSQ